MTKIAEIKAEIEPINISSKSSNDNIEKFL